MIFLTNVFTVSSLTLNDSAVVTSVHSVSVHPGTTYLIQTMSRFCKEDHGTQKTTAVCIFNLRTIFRWPGDRRQSAKATRRRAFYCLSIWSIVALFIFPFCNKFFNRFRDSGLANVTEGHKRNLFLFIYLIISKNSLSVLKYVSVIWCILTYCNIISIVIPKIVSPINFHRRCRC